MEQTVKGAFHNGLRLAVAAHASELLLPIIGDDFEDEVFLAGGAFKPLLKPDHPVRDLDLWVRNRKVRERLSAHLQSRGGELVNDFHPFCMNFEMGGEEIEVTYQNVKDRDISWVLERFDIAACSVAANFVGGEVVDVSITPAALRSFEERKVYLNDGYIEHLETQRSPDVLQSIDRITRFSESFDMEVPTELCEQLWEVFESVYSREEQEACVDTYLKTTVEYKGRCDHDLLRRASMKVEVAPVMLNA